MPAIPHMAAAYGKDPRLPGVHESVRRFALALVLVLAYAAPASASEHVMRVNEVGLSAEGGQFVELLDPASEPFPNPPYKLAVYDAAGAPVGSTPIDKAVIAGRATPVLLASAPTVGGQARDLPLTVTLPTDGQACFENNREKVWCLGWGNVTNKLAGYAGPSGAGVSPPSGKALSQCPAGFVVTDPTPKAANACPDTAKPVASVAAKTQKLGAALSGGYKFKVRSNEKGKARAQLVRKGKVVASATKTLSAGVAKSFSLRPSKATRTALASARSANFTLKVRVTDAAGNVRNVTRPVHLTR
jgi:hypothetical protein